MRRHPLVLALAGCFASCSIRLPPPPPPPIPAAPDDGALHVALVWSAAVDLDLYVTDPRGEALYFGNNPTRAGARLEQDARCTDVADGTTPSERANLSAPAPGRYRVGVDFIDACGRDLDTVPFRVAVDQGPMHRDVDGTIRRGEFKVIVLEFEVGEDGGRAPAVQHSAEGD